LNLNAIASQVIPAVNPFTAATLAISLGSTTDATGKRTPKFQIPVFNVFAQVQALTFRDIQQIDYLNLQGTRVAIYLNGEVDGLVRVAKKGGDIITIMQGPHAGVYLVALVLEQWNDWVKVAATLQNGS
jgi:hypothetical protein